MGKKNNSSESSDDARSTNLFEVKTKTKRAGLVINVDRMLRKFRKDEKQHKIRANAAIYMTAVIEYLVAEILDLSGEEYKKARLLKKKMHNRILPRHIMLACRQDAELDKLFKMVDLPWSGVVPKQVPKELLNKPNQSKSGKKK